MDVGARATQGCIGKCATELTISNIHECRDDELFKKYPTHITGSETRSILNVPILGLDNTLLGVMQWLGAATGQFDEHDEWLCFAGPDTTAIYGMEPTLYLALWTSGL
jgi:hypothetical protein